MYIKLPQDNMPTCDIHKFLNRTDSTKARKNLTCHVATKNNKSGIWALEEILPRLCLMIYHGQIRQTAFLDMDSKYLFNVNIKQYKQTLS